jgi:hypothetical protein
MKCLQDRERGAGEGGRERERARERANFARRLSVLLRDEQCGPGYLDQYSDSLRTGLSGDRIPVVTRFSAPVQTGNGAHPASYTMGTGPFARVKRPGHGVDHPPLPSAEVKEKVGIYLYSSSGHSWPVLGWTVLCLVWEQQLYVLMQRSLKFGCESFLSFFSGPSTPPHPCRILFRSPVFIYGSSQLSLIFFQLSLCCDLCNITAICVTLQQSV